MKGSIIIIGFFATGILAGMSGMLPVGLCDGTLSGYALYTLMFFVGMGIGSDVEVLENMRQINPRLLLLPLVTVAGTLAGCGVAGLFLDHRTLPECLAVGSGLGYYSLSGILITNACGAELGTVALLSNIIRELITLLFAAVLARYFGRLAPISAGGATTADTTLPVITKVSGPDYVIVSVFHGFATDFSVPFLVSFFCGCL